MVQQIYFDVIATTGPKSISKHGASSVPPLLSNLLVSGSLTYLPGSGGGLLSTTVVHLRLHFWISGLTLSYTLLSIFRP